MLDVSEFSQIVATLAVILAAIWLPGVIVIKASDHIRIRRDERERAVATDRPWERG
jgi:hypothetical protein